MPPQLNWDMSAARHLLSRSSFGGTTRQAAQLAAMPLNTAVASLIKQAQSASPPPQPEWVKEPWINTERVYPETTPQERLENHRQTALRYAAERDQLRAWWLDHMIHTPAPLREVMTLFWHGHFTTESRRMPISQALYLQNVKLRQHALGRFRDLLEAVILDAAMMIYLNMEDSIAKKPNENLARELLELFTVGIGNYTEKDIKEIARALTGWTLDAPPGTPKRPIVADAPRTFCRDGLIPTFIPERHDSGVKTILGRTGRFGLRDVLDIVAAHPATAKFICSKLITFFGVKDPKNELRDRMAETFVQTDGNIAAVLTTLFTSPEFYATESRGTLIKSPVHLLVGTSRLLSLKVTATPSLAHLTAAMGQELFNPPNVKGWPGGRDWISAGTLAVRYHLPEALFDGREPEGFEPIATVRNFPLPAEEKERRQFIARIQEFDRRRREVRKKGGFQVGFDPDQVFDGKTPKTAQEIVDTLMARLLVVRPRSNIRATLLDAVQAVPPAEQVKMASRLILMTPEYQLA